MFDIEAAGDSHDRSCVMLYLPKDTAKKVLAWGKKNIPDEWLAADGRETDPHVTVLYGIKTEELSEVEAFFPKGPVEVELGEVSRFDTSDEFDVIKVDVESDSLAELHYTMADKVDNDDSHPKYAAHITLAYVAKGKGKDLDGSRPFDGIKLDLADLVWSPAGEGDDRKLHINLGKEQETAEIAAALGANRHFKIRGTGWLWTPDFLK